MPGCGNQPHIHVVREHCRKVSLEEVARFQFEVRITDAGRLASVAAFRLRMHVLASPHAELKSKSSRQQRIGHNRLCTDPQDHAVFVPVTKYDSLDRCSIQVEAMPGRAMGMAMDQASDAS